MEGGMGSVGEGGGDPSMSPAAGGQWVPAACTNVHASLARFD